MMLSGVGNIVDRELPVVNIIARLSGVATTFGAAW